MKNTIKLFWIIALVAIIGFTMASCDNDPDNTGNTTLTYKGTSGSDEWVLKITGNTYELTKGMGLGTSTGSVNEKQGSTYYLKPTVTATMFTATVTSAGLVELQGTIVWYAGGTPEALPGQLTPSGGTGGNGGGGDVDVEVPGPVGPGGGTPSGEEEW